MEEGKRKEFKDRVLRELKWSEDVKKLWDLNSSTIRNAGKDALERDYQKIRKHDGDIRTYRIVSKQRRRLRKIKAKKQRKYICLKKNRPKNLWQRRKLRKSNKHMIS
ncbi:hypothetical protein J437_LFUL010436 [Ladona fulva]|uniref:Uncharacterized protein n=1 Tax=Ladona fulva TaxID=123851 RepID=A0A8K0P4P9_LADFU|nr:hypothetical protein J437_LFUL010436 [Ladona fulva]